MNFATENAGQDPLLLLNGAKGHEGGPDAVQGQQGQWDASPMRLLDEDHLVDGAPRLAAVLDRPPEAQPSVLAHSADVVGICRLLQVGTLNLRH